MIKIIAVGNLKEAASKQLLQEYKKRMDKTFTPIIIEIPEAKRPKKASDAQTLQAIEVESNYILAKINAKDAVYLCDVKGKMMTSVELNTTLQQHFLYQSSDIVFVIGGSDGVSETLKKRANTRLSFSKMTFPHQMFRIMLMEQLYRCYTLSNNIAYHK
jgi:23S rRNA (pseudouridine1915-N3)-methyltransferase